MLVLRILGALLIIVFGVSAAAYLVTRDRRWLRLSWKIVRVGVIIVLIILFLFILERLVIAI
jgi:hypothetical protein